MQLAARERRWLTWIVGLVIGVLIAMVIVLA